MHKFIIALFVCASMLQACEVTDPSVPEMLMPTAYYPMTVGNVLVYQVDSINYSLAGGNDTIQAQIKEEIVEAFTDIQNNQVYVINRSTRYADTLPWQITDVWSVWLNNNNIERNENNLHFIKMIAPIKENTNWAGHIYIGDVSSIPVDQSCNNLSFFNNWDYVYTDVKQPLTANGLTFSNTVTIQQTGNSNLLEYNAATETYALGVGLVKSEFYHYTSQNLSDIIPWNEKVECGYSIVLTILSYTIN